MHEKEWAQRFQDVAHFDKIKLRWNDTHPGFRRMVEDTLSEALAKLQVAYPGVKIHLPKLTVLDPSPAKPNGKLLCELNGLVAEIAQYLPAGMLADVTYAHVKAFVIPREGLDIETIGDIFKMPGGFRNYAPTYPGSFSHSPTKGKNPSHRLGSAKSGTHLLAYQRPAQPIGLEGKYRDEAVEDVTAMALDLLNAELVDNEGAWKVARNIWAGRAAEAWQQEFYARGLDIRNYLTPTTFEEWREGATYEEQAEAKFAEYRQEEGI